jgi:CheY-like chemotaxis protein
MDKIKVLIVEDHKVTQKLFDNALQNDIFEKKVAENGLEALDHYREWKPDVILLDILLPVVSGYTILKEIRKKEKDASTAIVITSSLISKEDIMDCVKLGIQGYLIKPINFKELSHKVLEYFIKAYPERATEVSELIKLCKDNPEAEGQSGAPESG